MIELREVVRTDAKVIYESWGRFSENFERLTAAPFKELKDAHRYLEQLFAIRENIASHIVFNGHVVGLVKAAVVGHRAQVGYVIHQQHWGLGLATFAVGELVAKLESQLTIQRVWATCALDNPGSVRVLEKCGFEREGVLRNWVVYPALGAQAVDNYSYVRVTPPNKCLNSGGL